MSMPRTELCDLLDIQVPIVQAPIGSASAPELAAAVANAGGLGMLALTWSNPEGVSVISTFWGNPAAVNDPIRAAGALHVHTVGSVAEACLTASADF